MSDANRQLTYRQLNQEATALAERITSHQIAPGSLLGVETARSVDSIISILAVILAGCSYVPLNPGLPAARIAKIIDRVTMKHAISQSSAFTDPRFSSVQWIAAHQSPAEATHRSPNSAEPAACPAGGATPALAYVMFTSGSTGEPKGVMISHESIVNLVVDNDFFSFRPEDRLLLSGALEFDASTFEIWGCLLNGASIHIAETQTLVVPHLLKDALARNSITTFWMTAPLFASVAELDPTAFQPLHTLLVGGDVVSPRHARQVLESCPGLEIINGYGPTENTTFTTTHRIQTSEDGAIPIGTPVSGATISIVDAELIPVPDGTRGELLVGGRGLALGYLRDPERSAAAFIDLAGERHYRTGDLVSKDDRGVLHFHGRLDNQVKIRGHRVELQEIENALAALPQVSNVRVLAPEQDHERTLTAYLVTESEVTSKALRQTLATVLPEYLVPERFVFLPVLPLTPNGKIDHVRLLTGSPSATGSAAAKGGPSLGHLDSTQQMLASCWLQCLPCGPEPIFPETDFFELGGSSITAGALISRLQKTGYQLTFQDIFSARTLAQMSERLVAIDNSSESGPIRIAGSATDSPMHPQQKGLHLTWQIDKESTAYNIAIAVDINGEVSEALLVKALEELTRRHDALSMRFDPNQPEPASFHPAGQNLEWVRSSDGLPSGDQLAENFIAPFDLHQGPLLRAGLVGSAEKIDRLYLDVHHIVFDGVSLKVLIDELAALLSGRALEPPEWSYREAVAWHHSLVDSAAYHKAQAYWSANLSGAPALNLPIDFERPPLRSDKGAILSRALSKREMDSAERLAVTEGTSVYVILLTAFAAALARLSGQTDLVIGSPLSGRTTTEFDSTVGMFVNTAPLRFRFEASASLGQLMSLSHQQHVNSLEHQIVPFAEVLNTLELPRDPSRLPVVEAFFALQNIDFHQAHSGGISLEASLLHSGSSRFDINLQVFPQPGGTTLELEYNTTIFNRLSAERILDSFHEALGELSEDLGSKVFGFPTDDDFSRLAIADFNF